MPATIAVYGATGYTGRQVAREFLSRGAEVLLSGRSRPKLEALADELGGQVKLRPAALDDGHSLRALAAESDAVVNCAGPFFETAEPVGSAAIAARTHYVDVSAEQHGATWAFGAGDREARKAGVAVLPSAAFDSVPADLLAALAVGDGAAPEEIVVAYRITNWRPNVATLAARLEGMRREWFDWDGELRAHRRWPETTWFDFPEPVGRRRVGIYPTPDVFTIPRHTGARRVRTYLTTSTLTQEPAGRFLPVVANTAARLMRTRARPLVERMFAASWKWEREKEQDPTKFDVVVKGSGPDGERRASLRGRGIYDLTAPIVADATLRLLADGPPHPGALAPAELLEPRSFLDALAPHGLSYELPAASTKPAAGAAA